MSLKHLNLKNLLLGASALTLSACSTGSRYVPVTPYEGQGAEKASVSGVANMAVASQGRFTTEAALEIEKAGGNAIDVAVAMSFVVSVERPFSTGLGGGGFMLLRIPPTKDRSGIVEAWDFRERAPLRSTATMFLNKRTGEPDSKMSQSGPLAVGVPGLVAGLWQIHQKYGKLPWKHVVKPSIRLAQNGLTVYKEMAEALEDKKEELGANPAAREIFFNPEEGRVWQEGELVVQRDLAETLKQVAADGPKSFYRGWIAKKIVRDLKSQGGILTLADFKNYKVKMRAPVYGTFNGYDIFTMPPPSSGGIHMLQILNTVEDDALKEWGVMDPRSIHLISSAMQKAFVDRAEYMGDPDFVKVPRKVLASKEYARTVRERINMKRAMKPEEWKPGPVNIPTETDHTVHFSVMSKDGFAIASTQTINGWFGSKLVAKGTGIVLNNEMDDFSAAIGAKNLFGATASSNANAVAPGKTPLSSMTPTLVFKDSQPVISLGTPSGTRILTCVAQVLLNRLAFEMTPWESVSQVRYHQQWTPDQIRVDSPGFGASLEKKLGKLGHKINNKDLGCRIQFVEHDLKTGSFTAVSDPRGEAWAAISGGKTTWND